MHRIWNFICQPQYPFGNPPDFIPLWFAAREDNTLSSRLTRPSHFPSVPFPCFDWCSHLAWEQRQCLVVAGYHSTESKSEWISYKW